jgi:acetyl esterase/lipase
MKSPRVPAVVVVVAVFLICLYSAYVIDGVIVTNGPHTVVFSLGTADRDVTYCNSQTLDLYIPSAATGHSLPLAIYVHGGGLTAGDKTDINPTFLNALASAGFIVASINYRLAPLYKFPAQIEDVKCAIRYLRANAQTYGINASQVFAFGDSSGGELVAIAALTGHGSAFDVGPYLNEPSGLTAAVDLFGDANLTGTVSSADLQRVFGNNQSLLVLASPTHYVSRDASPMLIIQGVNDTNVPESQSIEFYNELTAAEAQTQLILVQNAGHEFEQVGSQPISPSLAQIAQAMVNFFEIYAQRGG